MNDANSPARLTREPIDVPALLREVGHEQVGALAVFAGVVRAETGPDGRPLAALEYSAYEPMALRCMESLAAEATRRHGLHAVRIVHRLGELRIGEMSVAVVVSSAHRAAAMDACRELIERLKVDAPIFKRELWAGGQTSWVNAV